eukprot:2249951-Rhodomonas_salina.1
MLLPATEAKAAADADKALAGMTYATFLRAREAMSGTDLTYAATPAKKISTGTSDSYKHDLSAAKVRKQIRKTKTSVYFVPEMRLISPVGRQTGSVYAGSASVFGGISGQVLPFIAVLTC